MNKSLFSLLLILHVFFLSSSMARPSPRKLVSSFGPWLPIYNVSNPGIQAYGSYGVSEYNKNTTAHLEFIKVVNGSYYFSYYTYQNQVKLLLSVEAKNCTNPNSSHMYETLVYEDCITPLQGDPRPGYCYKTFVYLKSLG